MFAVVQCGGKQYKVAEGDLIRVEKLDALPNSEVKLDKVLLLVDGEKVSVGKPYLEGAAVQSTLVRLDKDPKKIVYKYKRRKDFDKKHGHRQKVSILRIDKILS